MNTLRQPRLGIVIPTLNEARRLPALLAELQALRVPKRIVVADGGSTDGTAELARFAGARVVSSPRGRGTQLRAGVAALRAPWLLLLHADSRMTPEACRALEEWLATADGSAAGHFRFRLDESGFAWRWVEWGQRIRELSTGLVFGDQGLVVHRSRLEAVGGVPDLPVMEDAELVRRLRRRGPVEVIPADLPTSTRRYRREGPVALVRNALLLALYGVGVSPRHLHRWYRPEPPAPPRGGGANMVLVFARAPVEGKVKTRLAAGIGATAALNVYRGLGRRVVDQLRGGRYRLVICHDPPAGGQRIAAWLGPEGLDLWPQAEGDLGERMHAALVQACHSGAPAACVVGTDAPGVDRSLVEEAFSALAAGADVVFGPALDGGYYLVALRNPSPELFQGIPWSTDQVLALSLARCRDAGLQATLLRPLRDVDTEADLVACAV